MPVVASSPTLARLRYQSHSGRFIRLHRALRRARITRATLLSAVALPVAFSATLLVCMPSIIGYWNHTLRLLLPRLGLDPSVLEYPLAFGAWSPGALLVPALQGNPPDLLLTWILASRVLNGGMLETWQLQNGPGATAVATGTGSSILIGGHLANAGSVTVQANAGLETFSAVNSGATTVTSGGALTAAQFITTAGGQFVAESAGEVTVHDAFSSAGTTRFDTAARLEAGSIDSNELLIVQGAATAHAVSAINFAPGTLIVDGVDSALRLDGNLTNGGQLQVQGGGLLSAGSLANDGAVAISTAGTVATGSMLNRDGASVNVAGAGSALTSSGVFTNAADATVGAGGTISADGIANSGALGTADPDSKVIGISSITNTGLVEVMAGSRVETGLLIQTAGTVFVNQGTVAAADSEITGGSLRGVGVLSGIIDISGTALVDPGLAPDTIGSFEVHGDFKLAGGMLELDIAGPVFYDVIAATQSVLLGGLMAVDLVGGYLPALGDYFDVITGASVATVSPSLVLPVLAPGLSWTHGVIADTSGERFRLTVVPVPAAWIGLASVAVFLLRRRS